MPTLRSYLDDPPFEFQPFVTITDMYSADAIRIRLMGTRLANAVGERTGGGFKDSFTERAASIAGELSWAAGQQKAGYVALRKFSSQLGGDLMCPTISLPLTNANVPHVIVTYFDVQDRNSNWTVQSAAKKIVAVEFKEWIDVGCGKPEAVKTGSGEVLRL